MTAAVPMDAPLVSIVTISFNQRPYLKQCLDSVIGQRCDGAQYIVVDPGSADGSRVVIARHAPQLDSVVLEPDLGPADGLNRGFARADGAVFGYINADDRLAPGAVRYVRTFFATHPDVDVLCGAIRIIDARGRAAWRRRTADRFDLARYAAGICTVGQQATFFRREAFERAGGFNVANRICWDGELLVDMALAGARFAISARVLGDFRIYPQSITGSNRHYAHLLDEHARIGRKIEAARVPLLTPGQARVRRTVYKLNPLRHARYLLAR